MIDIGSAIGIVGLLLVLFFSVQTVILFLIYKELKKRPK